MGFALGSGAMGDFIAVGVLIKDITQSLSDRSGSSKKYKDLIDSLSILGDTVSQVDKVFRARQRGRAHKELCDKASQSVKLIEDSLQAFNIRLQKFDPSLKDNGSGNCLKDTTRKIQFKLSEKDIEAMKREIVQSTIALTLLLETMALHIVEHNHEAITQQLASMSDESQQMRRDIHTRGRTLQDLAMRLGHQVLEKIAGLTQATFDVKESISQIAFTVFSISSQLASFRSLLTAMQRSPIDEYFIMEDALGRVFPIHLRTITSWDAFFFILGEKFKGERGARRVRQGLYKLLDNAMRCEISNDTRWERAFLPHQRVAMSLLCRGDEVSYMNDSRLTTCPRCKAQSTHCTSVQIQCENCNMFYARVIGLEDTALLESAGGKRSHSNSFFNRISDEDGSDSSARLTRRFKSDTTEEQNIGDEYESDDEDVSGFVRVTIISRQKKTRVAGKSRQLTRSGMLFAIPWQDEPFCRRRGMNFSTEQALSAHLGDGPYCEFKRIYLFREPVMHEADASFLIDGGSTISNQEFSMWNCWHGCDLGISSRSRTIMGGSYYRDLSVMFPKSRVEFDYQVPGCLDPILG